jgi:hypothetical protein
MQLQLKRYFFKDKYTIGFLSIDGEYFSDTLEDPPRSIKVMHETCIPEGTYKVIINESVRFKRRMPLLLDVPNFEGIRIHSGNTAADTSGCILVGENKAQGKVINSRKTFDKLMSILEKTKEEITIKIS